MDPSELLRLVTGILEGLGLRYLVTGSTATIFYGEPRFTNDIDIVVDLPLEKAPAFCAASWTIHRRCHAWQNRPCSSATSTRRLARTCGAARERARTVRRPAMTA